MKSTSGKNRERALLEDLQRAVHGIRAPFTCGGSFVPEEPAALLFPDQTQIAVQRAANTLEQESLLQPLVNRCRAASFGLGRKTKYDRAVRDSLEHFPTARERAALSDRMDPKKAAANARKHGIQFADAVLVLEDERAITLLDDAHAEERWVTIGRDALARVLTVVYTWRGDIMRIISARTATSNERRQYLENS